MKVNHHIRIVPMVYLRAILSMIWACIRYPLNYTVIDMSTGRIVKESGRVNYERRYNGSGITHS